MTEAFAVAVQFPDHIRVADQIGILGDAGAGEYPMQTFPDRCLMICIPAQGMGAMDWVVRLGDLLPESSRILMIEPASLDSDLEAVFLRWRARVAADQNHDIGG